VRRRKRQYFATPEKPDRLGIHHVPPWMVTIFPAM
jgi:hypothetical protein